MWRGFQMWIIQTGASSEPVSDCGCFFPPGKSHALVLRSGSGQSLRRCFIVLLLLIPVRLSRACLARDDKHQGSYGSVYLVEMVALLPCDFAVLPLRDSICFPIPLNLGSLCFCFGRVMLCNFQAWPLPGLPAAASCLLEARHHAVRTPTLSPQCSESPHPCVSGAGGWDTLWEEREAEEHWEVGPSAHAAQAVTPHSRDELPWARPS